MRRDGRLLPVVYSLMVLLLVLMISLHKKLPSSLRKAAFCISARRALAADLRHAPRGRGMALRLFLQRQRHFVIMRLVAERLAE